MASWNLLSCTNWAYMSLVARLIIVSIDGPSLIYFEKGKLIN